MFPKDADDSLSDVRQALQRRPRVIDTPGLKRSAVAMMITPGRQVWFIRRSERKGDPWSGHIAFPGGREDPTDANLLAVAMRETREELGVNLEHAELLGALDDLASRPMRSLMVRAYVFRLDAVPVFTPNYEVASVHATSLDALLAGVGRGRMRWPARVGIPLACTDVDGHRLWGLTLHMVDDLLDRIDGKGLGLTRPVHGR